MYADRRDAGRRLADRLLAWQARRPVILGLPRGGVPVAAEVAERLAAPLDVLVARKLGVPWEPELGFGAIAEGGVRVLNDALVAEIGLTVAQVEGVTRRERTELERRVARYRRGRSPLDVAGRVAILVDDGLATGYTARAGVAALRRRGARLIVVAVPVAADDSVREVADVADEVVAGSTPPGFYAIGQFYASFAQTTDDEVVDLLDAATRRSGRQDAADRPVGPPVLTPGGGTR